MLPDALGRVPVSLLHLSSLLHSLVLFHFCVTLQASSSQGRRVLQAAGEGSSSGAPRRKDLWSVVWKRRIFPDK